MTSLKLLNADIALQTTHTLYILILTAALGSCSAYGFRDRPEQAPPSRAIAEQVRFAGIRTPAARHIDTRLANAHLSEKLQASCPNLSLSTSQEETAASQGPTLSCLATAHQSRGAANALWANVTLECTLTSELTPPRQVFATGRQMLSPPATQPSLAPDELSSSTLATSQQMADTDALLQAIALLPCPAPK